MPVPISASNDLLIQATFFARNHQSLGIVANFVNPFSTTSFPLSATFFQIGTANLHNSATFFTYTDLGMSAVFHNPTSIQSLLMSGHFYNQSGTSSLPMSASFHATTSLPMTAIFVGNLRNVNLELDATFKTAKSLRMYVNAIGVGSSNLSMSGFLGHMMNQIYMTGTFYQFGHTDFSAAMTIQSYVPPHLVTTMAQTDFSAAITIKGVVNKDFLLKAVFGGASPNDFPARITINNSYFGINQVLVVASGGPNNVPLVGYSDISGYFHIDNLVPGTYVITPVFGNVIFIPPSITVTITNANVTLYFQTNGLLVSETVGPGSIPPVLPPNPVCLVTPNFGSPGTFSIDGYITPINSGIDGQPIIVVGQDDTLSQQFRQTFPNNRGEGQ